MKGFGGASIRQIALAIALERKSSVVLLEMTRRGPKLITCEDCAELREVDGKLDVLMGMVVSLRMMLGRAEAALAEEEERRKTAQGKIN